MDIYKRNKLHNNFIRDLQTLINNHLVAIKVSSLCPFDYTTLSYSVEYEAVTVYFFGVKSILMSYDSLMDVYKAIIRALPINLKNTFRLDFDRKGYSYVKVANASNLEFYNCKSKRISKDLADYLYNSLDCGDVTVICQHANKYISSYDFNISYTFQI